MTPDLRPTPPPPARRWTAWLLRLLLTAQAAMAVAQPLIIGRYLDGDFDQLAAHQLNGSLLPGTALLCLGAALLHRLAGGRSWPIAATGLLIPVEVLQVIAGYSRSLVIHIPLGTSIVALTLLLAGWSWTSRIRRTRSPRPVTHPADVTPFARSA